MADIRCTIPHKWGTKVNVDGVELDIPLGGLIRGVDDKTVATLLQNPASWELIAVSPVPVASPAAPPKVAAPVAPPPPAPEPLAPAADADTDPPPPPTPQPRSPAPAGARSKKEK